MTVVIGRHINGITLNGLEYILDPQTKEVMQFDSEKEAKEFIKNSFDLTKMSEEEIEYFVGDGFIYEESNEEKE